MKKQMMMFVWMILLVAMIAGCAGTPNADPTQTQAPTTDPVPTVTQAPTETVPPTETETVPVETVEPMVFDAETTRYIEEVYAEQIGRYYTALTEKWEEGQYLDNGMSGLASYYYEGSPKNNVGFSFMDLDNDGQWELIIGAILNAEVDPSVFEVWTLVDGQPVMLAQGGCKNRYVMQFVDEDQTWYVVNEITNGAANHATYFLMLSEGKLDVMQGIVFDAEANAENPWFMTWDLDGDASNDDPIDEDTASAIMDNNRRYYKALEYIPFSYR